MSVFGAGSAEDVAFVVCTAMHQANVTVVLSGGGAATIYAPKAQQTDDLDLVLPFMFSSPKLATIYDLGFKETRSRGIYAHPETTFTIEFLEGPLAVLDEVITRWDTHRRGDQILNILSPTDCVRDRLSATIAWKDLSSARQAAAVAKNHSVDMAAIEAWCMREGSPQAFAYFRSFCDR